jgi:hypothetical protein
VHDFAMLFQKTDSTQLSLQRTKQYRGTEYINKKSPHRAWTFRPNLGTLAQCSAYSVHNNHIHSIPSNPTQVPQIGFIWRKDRHCNLKSPVSSRLPLRVPSTLLCLCSVVAKSRIFCEYTHFVSSSRCSTCFLLPVSRSSSSRVLSPRRQTCLLRTSPLSHSQLRSVPLPINNASSRQ